MGLTLSHPFLPFLSLTVCATLRLERARGNESICAQVDSTIPIDRPQTTVENESWTMDHHGKQERCWRNIQHIPRIINHKRYSSYHSYVTLGTVYIIECTSCSLAQPFFLADKFLYLLRAAIARLKAFMMNTYSSSGSPLFKQDRW